MAQLEKPRERHSIAGGERWEVQSDGKGGYTGGVKVIGYWLLRSEEKFRVESL